MATEYLNNKNFEKLIVKFQQTRREQIKYQMFVSDILETEKRTIKRGKFKKPFQWLEVEKQFQLISAECKETQTDLAFAFYILSENIVKYAKFNLIDQDDAIQEAVMVCFEKIERFDPKKGKAFNYMTTCILNHFRQLYRTARNYNELKRKYLDHLNAQLEQQLSTNKIKSIYKKHNISNET
jgi:DNA-directed RNA polymerase specialized sigma subunit